MRTAFGRPLPAAVFLILNGVVLASVERLRSRQGSVAVPVGADGVYASRTAGSSAGPSAGHADAESDRRIAGQSWGQAIAAAGVLKLPELAGPEGQGILGPVLAGSVVAGFAAYASLRFLIRYFETRTLKPFAIYCVIAGIFGVVWSLAS